MMTTYVMNEPEYERGTSQAAAFDAYDLTNEGEFVRRVRAGEIGFPWKRAFITDAQIWARFAALKAVDVSMSSGRVVIRPYTVRGLDFKAEEMMYAGRPTLLVNKATDYPSFGGLSDMFQERERMKARGYRTRETPLEFLKRWPDVIAADCMATYGRIRPYGVRESIFWKANECSAFNPLVMRFFVRMFGARSVLDFSAGWGDRLIAALAEGIEYTGVDPNSDLFEGYKAIEAFFGTPKGSEPVMICSPIQTADLGARKYDMVFTSPPYFDLEEYAGAGRVREETEEQWMTDFLWPAIDKSLAHLKEGGHLVLNINQRERQTYIRRMHARMAGKKYVEYLGVVSYTDHKYRNPQPVWIWRKRLTNTITPSAHVELTIMSLEEMKVAECSPSFALAPSESSSKEPPSQRPWSTSSSSQSMRRSRTTSRPTNSS
jgi:hypothetical protein